MTTRERAPHPDCPFDPEEIEARFKAWEEMSEKKTVYNRAVIGVIVTLGVLILSTVIGVYTSSVGTRIGAIEVYGSPPLRERVSRTETEVAALRRDLDELKSGQREILSLLRADAKERR